MNGSKRMFISADEEQELRKKYGYTDPELDMVQKSRLYEKMADSLRSDAAHDAYQRRNPKLTQSQARG